MPRIDNIASAIDMLSVSEICGFKVDVQVHKKGRSIEYGTAFKVRVIDGRFTILSNNTKWNVNREEIISRFDFVHNLANRFGRHEDAVIILQE